MAAADNRRRSQSAAPRSPDTAPDPESYSNPTGCPTPFHCGTWKYADGSMRMEYSGAPRPCSWGRGSIRMENADGECGCPMSLQLGTWKYADGSMRMENAGAPRPCSWGRGSIRMENADGECGCPMSLQLGTWEYADGVCGWRMRVPHVPAVGDMGIARSATTYGISYKLNWSGSPTAKR